jgi:hypothetical protein
VICNNGFTIERYIHGWKESYNDIQPWDFKALLPTFGAKKDQFGIFQIRTKQELADLFSNKEFAAAKHIQVSYRPLGDMMARSSDFFSACGTLYASGRRASSTEAGSGSIGEKYLRGGSHIGDCTIFQVSCISVKRTNQSLRILGLYDL